MSFTIIFVTVCVYFVVHFTLFIIMCVLDPNFGHDDEPDWVKIEPPANFFIVQTIYNIWGITYLVGTTIILVHTRRNVRQRYGIPAEEWEEVNNKIRDFTELFA